MSLPPLPDAAVALGADAADWRAAVAVVGAGLVATGAAKPEYTASMVRMIEEHGPYVVIAPGLALAHARPGPDVLADGFAVASLAEPVNFGHPHNDPVRVVLGLAVTANDRHIGFVAQLANTFNDSDAVERIAEATSSDEVRSILGVPAVAAHRAAGEELS
ncbi:PTS sugar transporter subunit IIA [uncultured Schumannella sp.]|uniref:PTS sugar transporter subunit IIA n=1 Tax=uncultured Schumannella sp. TaxID=1195956 RepID=UPI0025F086E7|nr:PTS sugar transporter subunit IIA [uncultured Schumannella sp.]